MFDLYVAKDMVGNCSFMDVNGNEILVTSAEELTGSFTVYDIELPNTHSCKWNLTHNHLHPTSTLDHMCCTPIGIHIGQRQDLQRHPGQLLGQRQRQPPGAHPGQRHTQRQHRTPPAILERPPGQRHIHTRPPGQPVDQRQRHTIPANQRPPAGRLASQQRHPGQHLHRHHNICDIVPDWCPSKYQQTNHNELDNVSKYDHNISNQQHLGDYLGDILQHQHPNDHTEVDKYNNDNLLDNDFPDRLCHDHNIHDKSIHRQIDNDQHNDHNQSIDRLLQLIKTQKSWKCSIQKCSKKESDT